MAAFDRVLSGIPALDRALDHDLAEEHILLCLSPADGAAEK